MKIFYYGVGWLPNNSRVLKVTDSLDCLSVEMLAKEPHGQIYAGESGDLLRGVIQAVEEIPNKLSGDIFIELDTSQTYGLFKMDFRNNKIQRVEV